MNNQITTTGENKIFFTVQENSNYKVLMTYDREEVIEYGQFLKLMKVINDGTIPFLTINQRVVNKSTIIDISPTRELTFSQKIEAKKKKQEQQKIENRKAELDRIKKSFEIEFFNALYGEGNWQPYASMFGKDEKVKILTHKDRQDCWTAFEKTYPKEAKEILSL